MPRAFEHAVVLAGSRANGEDRAAVVERDGEVVIVVADGAGGLGRGGAAADAVVAAVREAPLAALLDVTRWRDVLARTDAELAARQGGETTAIVVAVSPHGLCGVSVGDSAAWLVTPADAVDLTAKQTRARLGSGRAAPVAFYRRALDGVLVVGTDGLFARTAARSAAIAAAARTGDAATIARNLASLARSPSGRYADDLAVVVVRAATAARLDSAE